MDSCAFGDQPRDIVSRHLAVRTGIQPQLFDFILDPAGISRESLHQQPELRESNLETGLLGQILRQTPRSFHRVGPEFHDIGNRGVELFDALELGPVVSFKIVRGWIQTPASFRA